MPFQEYQRERNYFTASPVPIQFLSSKPSLHSAHSFLSSGIQSDDYYREKKNMVYSTDQTDINHVQRL